MFFNYIFMLFYSCSLIAYESIDVVISVHSVQLYNDIKRRNFLHLFQFLM